MQRNPYLTAWSQHRSSDGVPDCEKKRVTNTTAPRADDVVKLDGPQQGLAIGDRAPRDVLVQDEGSQSEDESLTGDRASREVFVEHDGS